MFGKKKEAPKRRSGGQGLAQYGLFDIPNDFTGADDDDGSDENDSDLEAELAAITSGGGAKPRPKAKAKPDMAVDLDAMIAASMKDIPSDEEMSGDDDDPDLLNELSEIAGEEADVSPLIASNTNYISTNDSSVSTTQLLESRIEMYKMAEKIAKNANETSRARRFNRGLKTLTDLLKQSKAGRNINMDDVPPEVSVGERQDKPKSDNNNESITHNEPDSPPSMPLRPAPLPPINPINTDTEAAESISADPRISILQARKNEYKIAALAAKKSGDNTTAITYIKIIKQFDAVMKALSDGQPVDLSDMPGPPGASISGREESEKQQSSEEVVAPSNPEPSAVTEMEEVPLEILITASSVMEALQQRLSLYKTQMDSATQEENTSKARRMGRIVKQYEQAIKLHKAGKPIPIDDLPTPPGYAPIPVDPPPGGLAPTPKPSVPNVIKPVPTESNNEDLKPTVPPRVNSRKSGNQSSTSHIDRQVALLQARQKEFKTAALVAKQKGEINQAKELLRTAKGFDPLIQAAMGGLPVDMASLPIPNTARSQLEDSFAFVNTVDCTDDESITSDVTTRLEEQLTKQLKLCLSTRDHHKALADVAGTNRFEHLALSVTKDLDVVRAAQRNGLPPPTFHYENKSFSVVQCCTELGDNDLEVTIVRGVNYTVVNPKDVDTYVKFEFPFPQDEPFRERTTLVKDTNNPEYGITFTVPMQRSSRHCLRTFKRNAIKFEVFSRGGFLRSDVLIGTATVKLQPLETKCILHESFDLMDGRKANGGKLEIKIRVRNPMLTKQVEQIKEKWLIIDH